MIPIAETFHSIQGEGYWTGLPMHFIRLAGCPVGKAASEEFRTSGEFNILSPDWEKFIKSRPTASACKTYDGRFFPCDTDFSCSTHKSVSELVGETHERAVCLTGGEPAVHLKRLVSLGFFAEFWARGIGIHIETSGTIPFTDAFAHDSRLWVTVAPKWGCLPEVIKRADEVKLLVDEHFDPIKVPFEVFRKKHVFLSPINDEKTVNQKNVEIALNWLKQFPNWRLSSQWHKFLNLR